MKYTSSAKSLAKNEALIKIKKSNIDFGITPKNEAILPNPAELFLGSLCACILKNVERFSTFMGFTYTNATIDITATRLEKPPKMTEIHYQLKIHSNDINLNKELLKKNIEKYGTIFNTVKASCSITGEIEIVVE